MTADRIALKQVMEYFDIDTTNVPQELYKLVFNTLRESDTASSRSDPRWVNEENQKQWFVKNAMAILGAEVHLLIRDKKAFDFSLIEKWLSDNYSQSLSPQGQMKWVRASDRLPEVFPVSTHLRRVNHSILQYVGSFYETTKGKITCHLANHNEGLHLGEDQFGTIEWLDESPSEQSGQMKEALEKIRLLAGIADETDWLGSLNEIYDIARTALNSLPGEDDKDKEIAKLKEEISGWIAYKQNIDEALNSGDGVYRP